MQVLLFFRLSAWKSYHQMQVNYKPQKRLSDQVKVIAKLSQSEPKPTKEKIIVLVLKLKKKKKKRAESVENVNLIQ